MARNTQRKTGDRAEHHRTRSIDDLVTYDSFCQHILPELRELLSDPTVTPKDIYKKFAKHAAARNITIAMTAIDQTKALSAIKDILDRVQGKAKEHKEIVHAMVEAKEEEINARLISLMDQAKDTDDDEEDHIPKAKH